MIALLPVLGCPRCGEDRPHRIINRDLAICEACRCAHGYLAALRGEAP